MPDFTSFDGTRLAYTDSGAGLPVLCLSGLTRNGSDFSYVAPHLADVRLITLDYRGRGKSDWADPGTYTTGHEARDVLALLDHLGVVKTAILGTSRGGFNAMVLGLTAPERLLGVCFNDIGPEVDPTGIGVIAGYIGKSPTQRSLADVAMARARLMPGFVDVPERRWLEEAAKHFVETPEGLKINYDPDLAQIFQPRDDAPPPVDYWQGFDGLAGLPLALIRGENSDILPEHVVAEMRNRRPDMAFTNVPGRAHVPFLDEPDALRVIRDWLGQIADLAKGTRR